MKYEDQPRGLLSGRINMTTVMTFYRQITDTLSSQSYDQRMHCERSLCPSVRHQDSGGMVGVDQHSSFPKTLRQEETTATRYLQWTLSSGIGWNGSVMRGCLLFSAVGMSAVNLRFNPPRPCFKIIKM